MSNLKKIFVLALCIASTQSYIYADTDLSDNEKGGAFVDIGGGYLYSTGYLTVGHDNSSSKIGDTGTVMTSIGYMFKNNNPNSLHLSIGATGFIFFASGANALPVVEFAFTKYFSNNFSMNAHIGTLVAVNEVGLQANYDLTQHVSLFARVDYINTWALFVEANTYSGTAGLRFIF